MTASRLVVNDYLAAFYAGDFARAEAFVADDFHFKGPFVETLSKEAYFASAARLALIAKGHRMLHQWQDGDEICSVYDVDLETPAAKGSVIMSEWHTVRNGKLASSRLILDTAAFRALVAPA